MKKNLIKTGKIIILGIIASVGISYVSAALWKGPTAAPTGGNISAPIYVGQDAQGKNGGLVVGDSSTSSVTNPVTGTNPPYYFKYYVKGNTGIAGDLRNGKDFQTGSLAGVGERKVCADSTGQLQVCPTAPVVVPPGTCVDPNASNNGQKGTCVCNTNFTLSGGTCVLKPGMCSDTGALNYAQPLPCHRMWTDGQSGTITFPAGFSQITSLKLWGAGGAGTRGLTPSFNGALICNLIFNGAAGGSCPTSSGNIGGMAGGGGQWVNYGSISIQQGKVYAYKAGKHGVPGDNGTCNGANGGDGGNSSFDLATNTFNPITASGGKGGTYSSSTSGGFAKVTTITGTNGAGAAAYGYSAGSASTGIPQHDGTFNTARVQGGKGGDPSTTYYATGGGGGTTAGCSNGTTDSALLGGPGKVEVWYQ